MSLQNKKIDGSYVIWGKNIIFEALRTGQAISKIFIYKGLDHKEKDEMVREAQRHSIGVQLVEREELKTISRTEKNQGIVARISDFKTYDLREGIEYLGSLPRPRLVIILDSIHDPQNLGSILRSSAAAGVNLLMMNDSRSCPISESVFRVSEGGIFHQKIARLPNLVNAIKRLKDIGFWIYGFEADAVQNYWDGDLSGDVALLLGSEGEGMRELSRKNCDIMLKIPITGAVNSLNVAVTSALGVYEVLRQRNSQK
jgi:23S rRNA (guanosine2251-2'-O)-methyltransferase